jgi:hypothetical protein
MEGNNGIQLVKESLKVNEERDLLQHKDLASKLPLNKEIIKDDKGIFVHSCYNKKLIAAYL